MSNAKVPCTLTQLLLPDDLRQRMKIVAAKRGTTLRALVITTMTKAYPPRGPKVTLTNEEDDDA